MASVGRAFTSYNSPAHALYSAPCRHSNSTRCLQELSCSSREPFLCPSWKAANTTLNSILEKVSSVVARHQETEDWILFFITLVHWVSLLGFLGMCFIEYRQQMSRLALRLIDPFLAWCSALIDRAAVTIGQSHIGKKDVEIADLKLKLEDRLETLAELEDTLKHTRKCLAHESRQYRETLANSRADLSVFRKHMKDFEARFGIMREDNRILVELVDELETKVEDLNISNQTLWLDNENLWGTNEDLVRTNENWRKTMHAFRAPDPFKITLEAQLADLQTAYNNIVASNIKLREENTQCMNASIYRVRTANAQASTEAQNKLNNALHEINMLRSKVLDKEKGIERLTRTVQHVEVRLNTALSDVACLQNTPSRSETKHPMILKNEDRLVQTLNAKNCELKIEIDRLQQSLEKAESRFELRRYVDKEMAKYPIRGSEGFGDKGLEEPIEEESGYFTTETVELSESEDETVEDFEEILPEDVEEKCEMESSFSGKEGNESISEVEGMGYSFGNLS